MSTQDIAEAKAAMQDAREELKEAKTRFTAGWKKEHGEELTSQYDKDMQVELKPFYDNLQIASQVYLEEIRGQQQQGIGMGG
jgi:hypothetical protein